MKRQTDKTSLGQFEITSQLFTLIDGLPTEKQFILLKQLLGLNLPAHLMQSVLDMTEAGRVDLLKALDEEQVEMAAVTTISLDDSNNLMRGNQRQACRIPVRVKTTENTHNCTIVDISTFGVFIQSHTRHVNGKKIHLAFELPDSKTPFSIQGKIVRSTPAGVGVRFQDLSTEQSEAIRRFCETEIR